MKISVCIPTYNRAESIKETIQSILDQNYKNFEIVISDNGNDGTDKVAKSFKDKRIRYFKNKVNVGYTANLMLCKQRSKGEILYIIAAKNILLRRALHTIRNAFWEDIGAVVCPYYWYGATVDTVVRAKKLSAETLTVNSNPKDIIKMFKLIDNPASIAFRKELMKNDFFNAPFIEHLDPFCRIFREHKIIVLGTFIMATPALKFSGSQVPEAYVSSPMMNWIDMIDNYFYGDLKDRLVRDFVAVNHIGLVQIKNYGSMWLLLNEIRLLIYYRPLNLLSPSFWFFALGTIVVPRKILKKMVYLYKRFK